MSTREVATGHNRWVLPLCWAAVLMDGFDLVVLGSVLPVLLDEWQWGSPRLAPPWLPRRD